MAKAVRWQIPFVSSIEKTQYRIDIYDEQDGTWSGVTTLTGGPSPIVTDEDASDDFFAPIRIQTGNIEVCTAIPGGGTLRLEDILPKNNISRPVQLRSIASDMSEKIEWQGFLNCEAYSQSYTDIPEIIQLPINSVLEAMNSVQLNQEYSSGLKRVHEVVYHALTQISRDCNMTIITHVNYSAECWEIFNKYIDQTVFYERKEYNHEYSTTYIISGMSTKEVLSRLCTYMGWVCREQGTEIYFTRIGGSIGLYREELRYLAAHNLFHITANYTPKTTSNLADMNWMGTNHTREVAQGAKSVGVVANLEDYEVDIPFPDFPYVQLQNFEGVRLLVVSDENGGAYTNEVDTVKSTVSSDINFNNLCEFKEYKVSDDDTSVTPTTIENVFSESIINPNMQDYTIDPMDRDYVGAYMARVQIDDEDYMSGVYMNLMGADIKGIMGTSFIASQTNYIFSIRSGLATTLMNGTMKISFNGLSFYDGDSRTGYYRGALGYYVRNLEKSICIRFGNKYFNGSTWQNSFTLVTKPKVETDDNGAWIIPIDRVTGELFIYFYPHNQDSNIPADITQDYLTGLLLTGINVEFEQTDNGDENDRSENRYFRLLDTNFSDEISVDTNLASDLNNMPSPSLIMNSETRAMTKLVYDVADGPQESRRPEVDLLDRLAEYYSASRHRLNLEVEHPTVAPLSQLNLNGINDGKVYTPLAESRDWRAEKSTLTCFEIPN